MLRRLFAVGFAVFVAMYVIIGVGQRDVHRGYLSGCRCAVSGAWLHACYSHFACVHRGVGVVRDGA